MVDALIATILAATANWAVVEVWHHGEIFQKPRAWLEAHDPSFLITLLGCPYCLSHWTAAPLIAAAFLHANDPAQMTWHQWLILPVLWFATIRLSNCLNDALHSTCRTPREEDASKELGELKDIAEGTHDDQTGEDPT